MEDVRIGYQVAVDLARSNIEYVWSIFNALIVANSIVIAAISLLMMSQLQLAIVRYSLPIIGLTLCTIWWFIVKHARERAVYYTLSARELCNQTTINYQNVHGISRTVTSILDHIAAQGGQKKKQLQLSSPMSST